jgi:hypothetical protein
VGEKGNPNAERSENNKRKLSNKKSQKQNEPELLSLGLCAPAIFVFSILKTLGFSPPEFSPPLSFLPCPSPTSLLP